MTLRIKILLGFGGLLAILMVVSAVGTYLFARYSQATQLLVWQDYQSMRASQIMDDALQQSDSALADSLLQDNPDDLASALEDARFRQADFDAGLRLQRRSMNGDDDAATAALEIAWRRYRQVTGPLLDSSLPLPKRQAVYNQQVLPASSRVLAAVRLVENLNLRSLTRRQDQAQALAEQARAGLHALTLAGTLAAVVLAVGVGRRILEPLADLASSLRQVQAGNLDASMDVPGDDELGQLAIAFNEMARQLRVLRQRDHERLVRTERTTQLAIDSLPDPVVVLNPDGIVELTNEAARQWFHLQPTDQAAARREDLPWLQAALQRMAQENPPHRNGSPDNAPVGYESAVCVERDGDERFLLPRAVPIRDEAAAVVGATVVLNDVTGLRRLDQAKSGLLGLVSHELKTPLTSMRMILHLVAAGKVDGPLGAQLRDLLCTARDDSDRLHEIVENLLDMGRIEAGKVLMELRPVAVGPMLAAAAEPLQSAFAEAGVMLQIEAANDARRVLADTARVGHVVANLLLNALRHTPAGGVVRLGIAPGHDGDGANGFLECFVRDSGGGIPRQYLHRVFEKFFRVPGQSSGGSGLGLAIVKDIIEAHGGRVGVESVEGVGTTFRFTLRQGRLDELPAPTPDASPQMTSATA